MRSKEIVVIFCEPKTKENWLYKDIRKLVKSRDPDIEVLLVDAGKRG